MSLITFHRGGGKSLGYPPNCSLTIQWAVDFGARSIEYDIIYCKKNDKDEIIIVEPKLLQKNNIDINNVSWEEIQKINAGNKKFGECSIATFDEIQSIIPNTINQQIHIKGENEKTLPTLLGKLKNVINFILTSFDLEIIETIKKKDPRISVGWIVKPKQEKGNEGMTDLTAMVSSAPDSLPDYSEKEIEEILQKAKNYNVDIVILCGPRVRYREIIEKIKSAGFQTGAWGIGQNIEIAKRLTSYNIDRFTIDNPENLL